MLSHGIEAIVFDLYGTLLDLQGLEAVVQEFVPDAPALVSLWRAKQLEYAFIRTLTGDYVDFLAVTGDALDFACARLGRVLDDAARGRLLDAWDELRPFPDVVPALDALASRRLAVLSNGSPGMLERALAASGLGSRFAAVLSADLVQRFKPDPAVYALAPAHLATAADRILFVSSNGFDVAGAKLFGLRVVRLDRSGAPFDRLRVEPDATIRSLRELGA